jgi:hypothetical protein
MDRSVNVICRRVDRVELEFVRANIEHIVLAAGWDNDRIAVIYGVFSVVDKDLTHPLFKAEKLINIVDFLADILARLQIHQD